MQPAAVEGELVAGEGPGAANGVATGRFDADYLRPGLGEEQAGVGDGAAAGDLDDADAFEGARSGRVGHAYASSSNIKTLRATSPAFIARNASLMSSSRPRRVIISSSSSRPCRYQST